ncbi:hypothetical protein [Larkinella soli]|uniref:hypothetical protein n=1 Tax=Larkinella soli TaxID=1770527 RepID=UPI000FFC2736|nr:hypothetical protein [Larkinella soli]
MVLTVPELYLRLAEDQPLPDLLLLDYHLMLLPCIAPEVLKWIFRQDHLSGLAVQVWSSLPEGPEARTCRQLGARSFTSKFEFFSEPVAFVRRLIQATSPEPH